MFTSYAVLVSSVTSGIYSVYDIMFSWHMIMETNRYHYLVKTERVSQTTFECLESLTYIEGIFITNTKLNRVQLSLFHTFLLLTVSVKTLYFSVSTRRKESFSGSHSDFQTSKLVLYFGFIWFLTNFRL